MAELAGKRFCRGVGFDDYLADVRNAPRFFYYPQCKIALERTFYYDMSMQKGEKIYHFYKAHKRMPSYSEMGKLLGYKSKSAVSYFINQLIEEGILSKDSTGRLIPHEGFGEVKVLGLVEAGFPTGAQEEILDTMSLDEFLVENKEATYLLRVKGESMVDAGIMPDDLVLVERGKQPRVGDVVVAEVDGDYTLKFYKLKNGKPYLEPANKKFKPIYPKEELKIAAIVRSVIRKY
jgi:SOS regulatory protein LexA